MPITPIDMLTNVGQAPEVGRVQHAMAEALSEQAHQLDKEANDKSKTADSRLEHSREAEHATNRLDDRPGQGRKKYPKRKNPAAPKPQGIVVERVENGNLGNIIDIRK